MSHITTFSPIVLTLLIAGTGCALEETGAPEAQSDERPQLRVVAEDGPLRVAVSNTDKRVSDLTVNKQVPPARQPEDDSKAPVQDTPGDDKTPEGGGSGNGAPSGQSNLLNHKEREAIIDLIVAASPLNVASTIEKDNFLNFDFSGSRTSEEQGFASCTKYQYDPQSQRIRIRFECHQADVPHIGGEIKCNVSKKQKLVEVSCMYDLDSLPGKIDVQFDKANDTATVNVQAHVPQANSGAASITSSLDITNVSDDVCSAESGQYTLTTDDAKYSATVTDIDRCNNACLPVDGNISFDILAAGDASSERYHLQKVDAAWTASDDLGQPVTMSLCQ
jgi:hypothetical protein